MAKNVALVGTTNEIYGEVLTALLEKGINVYALVTDPEHLMLDTTNVEVARFNDESEATMADQFDGVDLVVVAYGVDLTDANADDYILRNYPKTVSAAVRAGIKRIVVVGNPVSEAFLAGELRHHAEHIDGKCVSTTGNYARKAAELI